MKKQIVKRVGNKEYYYNLDHKLVFRYSDTTINYRIEELLPKVAIELQHARDEGNIIKKSFIDNLIRLQDESELKAIMYIRYKILGTAGYLDVFGTQYQAEKQSDDIENIKKQLENLQNQLKTITDLLNKSA